MWPKKVNAPSPNLYGSLAVEIIELSSQAIGIKSQVVAMTRVSKKTKKSKAKGAKSAILKAILDVKVTEKEPPKQFLKGYKLDKDADPGQRYHYKEGWVYVHTSAPVLRKYFGGGLDRIKKDKKSDAVAILADAITHCVTEQMARHFLEKGVTIALGTNHEEEVQREKNKLDYKYGKLIHDTIAGQNL